MTPRHDITADHAIDILNRHLDGEVWKFKRIDSRTCVWNGPYGVSLAVREYVTRPHRIGIGNRFGRASFPLTSDGVNCLHDVAGMVCGPPHAVDLLRVLHTVSLACSTMRHRRNERLTKGDSQ